MDQLRHQAKELLRDTRSGNAAAASRMSAYSTEVTLAVAQLVIAREYGFSSWATLRAEIERRSILDSRDLRSLNALIASDVDVAITPLEHWCDHPRGASPLSYIAMLRYDTDTGMWRDVYGTGKIARALLTAGAAVDGDPADRETPLITAASYGDAEVALELIGAGANIEATASEDSGGVPGGTALLHAAVFGMTDVVDALVGAGAHIDHITVAAAAGDVSAHLQPDTPEQDLIRALVMAADHERLEAIDQLIGAGTPINAIDDIWGRQALWIAAENGRPEAVRRLLFHGADPTIRDGDQRTALDRCRANRANFLEPDRHDEVEAILSSTAPA